MPNAPQVAWRPATPADEPLLFELFAIGKATEFAPLGLTDEQLRPLLALQFRARQSGYRQQSPNALDRIVTLTAEAEDEQAIARHLIERQPDCYRSVDLAVFPAFRGCGVGTWALRMVQQMAAVEGVPVRLRVLQFNPARALYERLGFVAISADELSFEMEWTPPADAVTATQRTATGISPAAQISRTLRWPRETPLPVEKLELAHTA